MIVGGLSEKGQTLCTALAKSTLFGAVAVKAMRLLALSVRPTFTGVENTVPDPAQVYIRAQQQAGRQEVMTMQHGSKHTSFRHHMLHVTCCKWVSKLMQLDPSHAACGTCCHSLVQLLSV